MSKKERVLVLFDAAEPTTIDQDFSQDFKDISWETEAHVVRAVRKLGHEYAVLGVFDDTHMITEKIQQFQPTVIFNLIETFRGNTNLDRDIASFLKLTQIPFTGCGPTGLTLCKNKALSKQILSYHRIRVPQFAMLPQRKKIHRPARLKFPLLIKPLAEEASYGISQASFVENDAQFTERVQFIHESMKRDAIAEEYIEGRELYVSLLGNKRLDVFPIRELKFFQVPEDEPKIATYKAKWDLQYRKKWGIRNQFAKGLPEGAEEKIRKVSKKIYHLLSIRGYARMDLRLTNNGEVYFIEANPNPILSEWEDFCESGKKSGQSFYNLIQRIITLSKQAEE